MTPAAHAANAANGQKSTGPVTPEGKGRITQNALDHGFFAQQKDHLVAPGASEELAYDDIVEGLMRTYRPANFVDQGRVYRLALLLYKRSQLLEPAEAGERTRSLMRHRRAVRFATPPMAPAELLGKDPLALRRRRDGVEYLADQLEELRTTIATMKSPADMLAAAQPVAGKLQAVLPSFQEDVAQSRTKADITRAVTAQHMQLNFDAQRLRDEEIALAGAEEARRLVPGSKHADKIMRAMREVNREIKYLEWCLSLLYSPFGRRGR